MALDKNERYALESLHGKIKEQFGDELHTMYLFGSKARGDDTVSSDVDVLIVLSRGCGRRERAIVSDIIFDVLEITGIYIQSVVLSRDQFTHPTGQLRWLTSFVREEGIAL